MESFIADDVKGLLRLKKGDSERLGRIMKLCKENKLISLSDRKYVERLSSQYLYKTVTQKPKQVNFQPTYKIEKTGNDTLTSNMISSKTEYNESKPEEKEAPSVKESVHRKTLSNVIELSPSKKIAFGIGAIVLAIVVIALISIAGNFSIMDQTNDSTSSAKLAPPYITVSTDESSYVKADIISIAGESNPPVDGSIRVSIENTDKKVIWAENLKVKDNGDFSTLLIAAGTGWEKSGEYTVIIEHDTLKNQIFFNFVA